MKYTIDSVKNEYDKLIQDHKDRDEKIADLEKNIADLDEQAKACAIADDVAGFKQIKQETEYKNFQLDALKMKQENEKVIALAPEKVQAAWEDYESKRRKKVNNMEAELEDIREKLLNLIDEITKCQIEGLKTRNECAKYIGMKPITSNSDSNCIDDVSKTFPMKYFNFGYNIGGCRFYEFEYLENIKKITCDLNQRIHRSNVFVYHVPASVIVKK